MVLFLRDLVVDLVFVVLEKRRSGGGEGVSCSAGRNGVKLEFRWFDAGQQRGQAKVAC